MTSENLPLSRTDDQRFAWRFWWITLGVKAILGVLLPLFADEAYYWVWARHLDWSYYDHPPMIAWWFAVSDLLHLPRSTARLPGIFLGHLGLWIWIRILTDHFPGASLRKFLWLYALCPLTGLAGLAMTPDLPLSLFWGAAVFFSLSYLKTGSLSGALGLGSSLGLGFLSKYMIVLFPLVLVPVNVRADFRKRLFGRRIFLVILAGALFSTPVIAWNWLNGGVSFYFQLGHGLDKTNWQPSMVLDYTLAVGLLLLPIWFDIKRGPSWRQIPTENLVLLSTGLGPFVFFFLTSFRAPVELNWPAMGLPSLIAFASLSSPLQGFARWFYGALTVSIFLLFALPSEINPVPRASEWREYDQVVDLVANHQPLYASSYQMASVLWFRTQMPVYKLRGSRRIDMYDRWEGSAMGPGTSYFLRHRDDRWPDGADLLNPRKVLDRGPFELWEIVKP